jgi:translation initiation factor IF-2
MQPPVAVGDFVVIPVPAPPSVAQLQHAIERQQHEWHEAVGRARSSPVVLSSSANPSPMRSPRGHASPMPVSARTPASGRSTGGSERTQRGTASHGSMGSRARPVSGSQREGGRWNGAPLTAPAPFSAAGAPPACSLSGGGGSAAGAPSELHMPPPNVLDSGAHQRRRQQVQRDTLTQAVGLAEAQAAEAAVRESLLRSEVGGTEAALAQAANALRGARGERNNLAQQLFDLNQRLRAAQAERAALAPPPASGAARAGARRAGGLKGGSGTGGGALKGGCGGGGGGGGGGGSTTASDGEFDESRGARHGARSQRRQPSSATDGAALQALGRTQQAELAGLREQVLLPDHQPMLPGYRPTSPGCHPSWQGTLPLHP